VDDSVIVSAYIVLGLGVVLAGWCRFQINARRFRRRTIGGGQRFHSYGSAVFTQLWEGLVMTLATVYIGVSVLIGLGFAVLVYEYR
jgi:hypothetical protein